MEEAGSSWRRRAALNRSREVEEFSRSERSLERSGEVCRWWEAESSWKGEGRGEGVRGQRRVQTMPERIAPRRKEMDGVNFIRFRRGWLGTRWKGPGKGCCRGARRGL